MKTFTHYDYRWAKIMVYASFLNRTPEERSNEFLHELLHISFTPYAVATGDVVDFIKEKFPDVFPWALEVRRAGMEATIVDFTDSIVRHTAQPHA